MSFYGIRCGTVRGEVLLSWPDTRKKMAQWNVDRKSNKALPPVQHKKFATEQEANAFLITGYGENIERRANMSDYAKKAEKISLYHANVKSAKERGYAVFHVDGACDIERAQIGAYNSDQQSGTQLALSQIFTIAPLTNQRCEIASSILALQAFADRKRNPQFNNKPGIAIFTDNTYSIYVQETGHGLWYNNGIWLTKEGAPVANVDLIKVAVELRRHIERNLAAKVEIYYVPGSINIKSDTLSRTPTATEHFSLNRFDS